MRRLLPILTGMLLAALLAGLVFHVQRERRDREEEASVLLHQINAINTLMLVEANLSEVYTFRDTRDPFYGLWPQEKSVILIVRARAMVGYDLDEMDYTIDPRERRVTVRSVPEPEIIIEPHIEFYDIEQSTFNRFTPRDFTTANERAMTLLRKEVERSGLEREARDRLESALESLVFASNTLGWDVELPPIPDVQTTFETP